MTDTVIESPKTVIKPAIDKLLPHIIGGIAVVGIGLLFAPNVIWIGIMVIIIFSMNGSIEVFRSYSNYSEVKLAIARPRWFILNSSIESADVNGKVLTIKITEEDKTYTRKIPLNTLSDEDGQKIISYYKAKAKQNRKSK
ncbi:hypothetical protein GCM10009111_27060 [Colwellia asteriadis]|uniref:PH domain-containing protein n=1 Tax=Colwellia asteriadis TaxID=517723 RepID=A0ABP3WLV0_9GAMM